MAAVRHRARAGRDSTVRRSALLFLLSGLIFTSAASPAVLAQVLPLSRASAAHPHAAHITEASQRFGIPAAWIVAVMRAESAGHVRAVSSAGAMGLMQVMPDTWAELRIRYGLGRDPYDPRDNILAGTAYLREMWDRYGNVAAMLAAYNAGPARYDEYRMADRPLPTETRAYVATLAPMLFGEQPSGDASAVARPLDWREAGLFVSRGGDASSADPATLDRAQDDTNSLVPAAPEALTDLQPEGLFVARNAGEDRP
ncbi:transglycosylase-like protein with SLT domain [Pseudaminobacter salicylatoxidans]|uniref:Transglycosylase-like protein with SLT domain n=1 Tax=Pseudaminobacter salicylatoxidans TaxID=93369 RepID=A0A316BW56_PSESE|nr:MULTISPECIES: lytic transglycosylase domain-containing protein [Hyphomicrobiales]PWJ76326.1 transglycosylase-like protein with SLT domain [Pseudaminobacter salicylatoxidans]